MKKFMSEKFITSVCEEKSMLDNVQKSSRKGEVSFMFPLFQHGALHTLNYVTDMAMDWHGLGWVGSDIFGFW
jgi:hypothetical protein